MSRAMHIQEIELKLRLEHPAEIMERLTQLGATFVGKKVQHDTLFESPVEDFSKSDKALRLRRETVDGTDRAFLTFKGSATHSTLGHKIRDEFETLVDADSTQKILEALGFIAAVHFQKTRQSYELQGVFVELDTLSFGTFIELEGTAEAIETVRQQLGLQDAEPVKEGYCAMFLKWKSVQ